MAECRQAGRGRFEATATSDRKLDAWWINDAALAAVRAKGGACTGLAFRCRGDGSANMGAMQLSVNGGQSRFVDAIHELGRELHAPVAECFDVFRALDDEIGGYYGDDDAHLNVQGHMLVAGTLEKLVVGLCGRGADGK